MTETGMEKSKLISSFGNSVDKQRWIDMKIPEDELSDVYSVWKNSSEPSGVLSHGTAQHKAQRWENYKEGAARGENSNMSYKDWSNVYDGGIGKVGSANEGVKNYAKSKYPDLNDVEIDEMTEVPWPGTLELTFVSSNRSGTSITKGRRHDIYDRFTKSAREVKDYKSGKVALTEDIEAEVLFDLKLLEDGSVNSVEWVFLGEGPTGPLKDLLETVVNGKTITIKQ